MRYAVPGTKIIFKISAKNLLIFLLLVTLIGTLSYTSISLSHVLEASSERFYAVYRGTVIIMRSGNTEMDESLQKREISILEYLEWRNHIMEEVANILRSNGFEVYEYRLSMIGVSIYRPLDELPPHLKEVVEERIERIRKELAIRGYNESVIESVVKREAELGLQIVVDLVGIPQDLPKEFLPAIIRGKYPRGEVECAVSKSVYSILREMGFELGAEIPLRMIIYSHDTDGIGRREMRRSCKLVGVIGEDSFLHLTGSLSVNTTMMVTERGLRSLIEDTDRLTSLNLLAIGDPRNVSRALAKVNSMELVKRNKLYLVPATLLWRGVSELRSRAERVSSSLWILGVMMNAIILPLLSLVLIRGLKFELALLSIMGLDWKMSVERISLGWVSVTILGLIQGIIIGERLSGLIALEISERMLLPLMVRSVDPSLTVAFLVFTVIATLASSLTYLVAIGRYAVHKALS